MRTSILFQILAFILLAFVIIILPCRSYAGGLCKSANDILVITDLKYASKAVSLPSTELPKVATAETAEEEEKIKASCPAGSLINIPDTNAELIAYLCDFGKSIVSVKPSPLYQGEGLLCVVR